MRENLTPFGGKGGLGGETWKRSDDNVYLDISTLLTNEHLAFMYGSSPKREVGAENVCT